MKDWLAAKLGIITKEFLDGGGYGDVFEVSYLTYLECLQVALGLPPELVWAGWQTWVQRHLGDGVPFQPLNRVLDRQPLVDELEAFRRSLAGPRRRTMALPKAQPVVAPGTVGGDVDVLDFLSGGGS